MDIPPWTCTQLARAQYDAGDDASVEELEVLPGARRTLDDLAHERRHLGLQLPRVRPHSVGVVAVPGQGGWPNRFGSGKSS